ncbi:DUF551 domain-containing protein [Enterobacter quasiroggenkampii]|uniref:DUF551 domain-containing protein n=1 Tax=Enterobacter quasiroggenkampii TaxID=2497436 RepID=UPI0021CF312D
MSIALPSLNAEPVAWLWSHRKHPSEVTLVRPEDDERAEGANWSGWSCQALYAAPPAPVSVPHELTFEKIAEITASQGYEYSINECICAASWWNACRAAMLQGAEPVSNHDELPLDYLQGQKDGLEWAAQLAEANHPQTGDWLYDDPVELAKAIRKGPDMPEACGNSPVIQDGWVACSERMPETDGNYWGWWSESKRQGPVWFIKSELQAQFQSSEITHWMPLPAAPQQEVTFDLNYI